MTTRAYDYIVSVADASAFSLGSIVFGLTSNTIGEIVSKQSNNLKVRLSNIYSSFSVGETIRSNLFTMYSVNSFVEYDTIYSDFSLDLPVDNPLSDSIAVYIDNEVLHRDAYSVNSSSIVLNANYFTVANTTSNTTNVVIQVVTGNTNAVSFISSNISGQVITANSTITAIYSAPYIAEKNATEQTPIVRLYSIYYPGEWYPTNANGNPTKSGAGYSWPYNFPLRYAEFIGETYTDFNYSVSMNNTEYRVIAMNGGELNTDSSGTINGTSLEISNFDGVVSSLIENKNILGYNSSNSVFAYVNGELVKNIDPRTVPGNFFYNAEIAGIRGVNAAWDYETTIENGDTWVSLRDDSRDMLGAVVEIKMTYAKFLDYWPEYSRVTNVNSNVLTVQSSTPYRIGDRVFTSTNNTSSIVQSIDGNNVNVANNVLTLTSIENGSRGISFKPDGSKAYVIGQTNDRVAELTLTIPWDINSAYLESSSPVIPVAIPTGIYTTAGNVYISSISNAILQYSTSNAWSANSMTLVNTLSTLPQTISVQGIFFKPQGDKMYVLCSGTDRIYEYNLSTPWNISTATYSNNSLSTATEDANTSDLYIKNGGKYLYTIGVNRLSILEWEMASAWNISSATRTEKSINLSSFTVSPQGVYFNASGEYVFIVDVNTDLLYKGDLSTPWDISTTNFNYLVNTLPGSMLLIQNPDADSDAVVEHTFVINRLDEMNDFVAKFSLTNLLQYFKMELPKRKYFRTTCPWAYKGAECKYPVNGSGPIVGSNPPLTSNGFFTYSNVPTLNDSEDICAKTYTACALRRNLTNFGGFSNGI